MKIKSQKNVKICISLFNKKLNILSFPLRPTYTAIHPFFSSLRYAGISFPLLSAVTGTLTIFDKSQNKKKVSINFLQFNLRM